MARAFGLQTRKEVWPAAGDPSTVFSSLLEAARRLGGRIKNHTGDTAEIKFGSIFNYRLLGLWSKPNKRPLVLKLGVHAVSQTFSEIEAEALSNPGWAPFPALTKSLVDSQYEDAFQVLFDGLQNAVPTAEV
jgi:hypothetical protein